MKTFDIQTLSLLEEAAQTVAAEIRAGDVLTLSGELGSGKTTFTTALAKALGVSSAVTSPTFTILQRYPWQDSFIYHLDLYRLTDEKELVTLGISELLEQNNGLVIIEWPQLLEQKKLLPSHTRSLVFSHYDEKRTLTISDSAGHASQRQAQNDTIPQSSQPALDCLFIDSTVNKRLLLSFKAFHKQISYENPRSQDTLKQIEQFLTEHQLTLNDIRSIQVATGPGNFTSLRTGIATAQALAFALNVPINSQPPGTTIFANYGMPPSITVAKSL